jgi:hypothetical protein
MASHAPKPATKWSSENWPFFPSFTTTRFNDYFATQQQQLHSRPPTTSFLLPTPRQTPIQD